MKPDLIKLEDCTEIAVVPFGYKVRFFEHDGRIFIIGVHKSKPPIKLGANHEWEVIKC